MLKTVLFALASISALVFIFLLAFFPIQDSDIFIYLSIGRWFLNFGSYPPTEAFVFSTHAPSLYMNEWASIMFYTYVFKWGGYAGLIATKALLIVAIFCIPILLSVYLRSFSVVTILISVIAALAASHRFIERASLFSDMFTALTVAIVILEYHRPSRLKYFLPLIFLVWVNLHPGFLVGLVFVYMLFGFQLLSKFKKFSAPDKKLLPLGITIIVSTLATFATPAGIEGFLSPFRMMFDPNFQFYSKYYQEFLPVYKHYAGQVELYSFWVLSALTFLLFIMHSKKPNLRLPIFEFLIFLALFILTLKMSRMISAASYSFAVISVYLYSQINILSFKKTSYVLLGLTAIAGVAASIYLYHGGYHFAGAKRIPANVFTLPIDTRHQPVRAVMYFQNKKLKGNIFNDHVFGGYLVWAWNGNPPVFYHGLIHDPQLYLNDYLGVSASKERFEEVVAKYQIHYFILENLLFIPLNQLGPPYTILMNHPKWKLTFQDEAAVVFERD